MDVVKLGILGGTFDPIHNGHLKLAETVQQALNLSRILFVPAGDPPHKQGRPITPAVHRLKMVELAIAGKPHFQISGVDLDRPGPHYSVEMVARLRAEYNLAAENCYFIIGADSLALLPTWRAPQQLLAQCRLAVAHRPGYRPNLPELSAQLPGLAAKITWVQMAAIPISGTTLRQKIAGGESISNQIPPLVARYIEQMGLYK